MIDFRNYLPIKWRAGRNNERAKSSGATEREVVRCHRKRVLQLGHQIAVSWDNEGIKLATARHLGPLTKVIDVTREHIPPEMADGDQLSGFVADRIAQYVRRQPRFIRQLSLVVSDRDTVFRSFSMPSLKGKDLKSAVRYEAQKQLPFPAEQCHLGFQELYRIKGEDHSLVQVGLHAATAKHVKAKLEPLLNQDVPVVAVHHAPEAVGRLLQFLSDFDTEAQYTVLELTPARSIVAAYRGTDLQFTNAGTTGSAILSDQALVPARLESFAEAIVADLQVSQDFFGSQASADFSNRILLYGELGDTEELLKILNGRSSFEFEVFPLASPAMPLKTEKNNPDPQDITACVAVLASAMNQSTMVNLLPLEPSCQYRDRRLQSYAKAAVATLVVGLAIRSAISFDRTNTADRELQQVSSQLVALQSSEAHRAYHIIKRQIVADRTFLESAKEKRSVLALALKELSRITDSTIQLHGLQMQSEAGLPQVDLTGVVSTGSLPPEIALAEFVEALRASPFFDRVEVVRHSKKVNPDGFEIRFSLRMIGVIS